MNLRKSYIAMVVMALIFSLAACGGSSGTDASSGSAAVSSADQQEVVDKLAEDAEAVPEPDTQTAAVSTDSSAQTSEEKLLGEWADINDETRTVKITANGSEYEYTDPDGAYKGTVKDGVLTIKISDAENDTAMVFIDSKTGNLVTNYQGDIYEFTRKIQ